MAVYFSSPGDPRATDFRFIDAIATFAFITSLALFLFLRTTSRSATFVLDLSLAYMVLTAVDLGVMLHWGAEPAGAIPTLPMITWIGPMIIITAAIVPAEPWKMAVAAFLAASMDPIGMFAARAFGIRQFEDPSAFLMHYPNYLMRRAWRSWSPAS